MSHLTFRFIPFTEKGEFYTIVMTLLNLVFIALMMRPGWILMTGKLR